VLNATREKFGIKREFVSSTLPERMPAVAILQAASLQTTDGTFAECRVTSGQPAFNCAGVDYFGPIVR